MKEKRILARSRLVRGVGINDADYAVAETELIDGKHRIVWRCPYYITWNHMLERGYCPKWHKKYPTYRGCSVVEEWKVFSNFKAWMETQEWVGLQLDKDFLEGISKVYSPEKCVFISQQLNKFPNSYLSARGELPLGVSWHKQHQKYAASCNNPFKGKSEHLGYFHCADEAHNAWKGRKHQLALVFADNIQEEMGRLAGMTHFTDERVADRLRTMYL